MKAKLKFIIAVVSFGTIGLFVKNIPLQASEIALYRGVIALAALAGYLWVSGGFFRFRGIKPHGLKLFLSGAAMGFNWILLFEAYNYTSVALSTLSYYFAPVLVILLSPLIFKEKPDIRQMICFAFATAGLVLVIGVSSGAGSNDLLGVSMGLGAAVLYAVVILTNKSIGSEADGIARTIFQFASAVVVLLPYVGLTAGFHLGGISRGGFINLLIVGAYHTGFVYYLYFSSLNLLKGQEVALLSYIDPLVAVLISILLLHEQITSLQLLGGGIILVFTLINEYFASKAPQK